MTDNRRSPAPVLPAWLAKHVPFRRYTLRVEEYDVHVMESGPEDGRPVVLFHGNPTWGFLYRKVVAQLEHQGFRCIMPDLIGLGFSTHPRSLRVHTLENHARWMADVVRQLDVHDAIAVVQDWGGPIGTLSFAEQANRLRGMVVLNTVLSPPREGFTPTPFHRFSHMPGVSDLIFRGLGFPQLNLNLAQGDKSSMNGVPGRAYRYALRGVSNRAAPLALARMVPNSMQHPSVAPLRRCQRFIEESEFPIAVVWGKRDPILGSAFNWVRQMTSAMHVVETGGGHFLQEEAPAEIAEAVRVVHDASAH